MLQPAAPAMLPRNRFLFGHRQSYPQVAEKMVTISDGQGSLSALPHGGAGASRGIWQESDEGASPQRAVTEVLTLPNAPNRSSLTRLRSFCPLAVSPRLGSDVFKNSRFVCSLPTVKNPSNAACGAWPASSQAPSAGGGGHGTQLSLLTRPAKYGTAHNQKL
jgi:hypothetical protein